MDRFANLYGDLSSSGAHALVRDKEFGKSFLARRADRLLFGTDYYDMNQIDFLQFTMFDEFGAHGGNPPQGWSRECAPRPPLDVVETTVTTRMIRREFLQSAAAATAGLALGRAPFRRDFDDRN